MIGTAFFTMAERGQYICLLCYQHQLGHLSEADILTVTTTINPKIMAKFKQDSEGKYYNERLDNETNRRKSFTESRLNNLKGKKHKEGQAEAHMGAHMETETITETITKDKAKSIKTKKAITFVRDNPPTLEEVTPYCIEKGIDPQQFHDANTAVGWVDKNKTPYRDWKAVVRKWANYRKATSPITTVTHSKPPVALAVATQLAMPRPGMSIPDIDREIMQKLVGTYSEHAVIEALGHARGKVK